MILPDVNVLVYVHREDASDHARYRNWLTGVVNGPQAFGLSDLVRLCREAGARGNLVPDAWFAALAIESGSDWITTDRDYARFPGLRWRHPFDGAG